VSSVIVTNAKSRIAYNIVRSLGKRGIKVYPADYVPRAMSFASRFSRGHFVYPSPFRDQAAFIKCLVEHSRRLKADVVIPVHEETFVLAKFRHLLPKEMKLVLPDYEKILLAHNKDRWTGMARELGIPVPPSCSIDEVRRDNGIAGALRFPVLIKPSQGGGAWGITQVDSRDDLLRAVEKETYLDRPWDRFFIQEKIEDHDTVCVAMLTKEGGIRAKIAYRQVRDFPVKGGQATFRISLHHEQAEHYFQRLLETLKWHGVCQGDFVVDRKSGVPYLIDINPRFWGSLTQAIASGVDFPYLVYRIAIDGDVAPVEDFREGVMTRWVGGDLMTLLPSLRLAKEKLSFLRTFFFPGADRVMYDDWSAADPLPFFAWGFDALVRMVGHRSLTPAPHDSLEGVWT
jgi:predicted ATP-grasp superfamily ATP-dependent carboligase